VLSGNPAGTTSLEDLGTKPVGLVIEVDTVLIGEYTCQIFEIPEEYNVKAFNYAGVLKNVPNPELTQKYLDFILTPEGQDILWGFGYEPIEGQASRGG
jgi:ABC-type molybdate transport system substrate-binding protein